MVKIEEKDGVIILDGESFDLKIDNNRRIYVKSKDKRTFNYIEQDIGVGYSVEEKKKYLYNLYLLLKENNQQ